MLKKLLTVAFILTLANQVSAFAEMTPLQMRVRAIFSDIRNREQAEVVKEEEKIEEVVEDETPVSATPAKNDISTQIILASDQDDVEDEDYDDEEDEEGNEEEREDIVVATAPKAEVKSCEVKPCDEVKTAAEASAKDRTAQISKKWSIEALGWNTELSGHFKIADNENELNALTDAQARIDLKSNTTLDKKKVPGLRLSYRHGGRSTIEFNWAKIDQNGRLKGVNKTFKGKEYRADDSNFEINNSMYDLVWKYRFAHKVEESGREKSYVAGLLGVKASKMEFNFRGQASEDGGNTYQFMNTHEKETIPVPYLGVEAGTYLGEKVYLKGYFRYLKLNNVKNYDAKHSDFDVSLSYRLSGNDGDQDIFFDVGYKQVVYDVEGKGKDVELKYKGPYVGLEFKF